MKTLRSLGLLALVFGLSGACSTETSNKNTNWLVTCTSDAECGEAACLCGVCTRACSDAPDCAASSGTCSETFATTTQCGGSAEATLCLPACSAPADCDESQVCVGGACVLRYQSLCAAHEAALACSGFDESAPAGWDDASSAGSELASSVDTRFSGGAALLARTTGANGRSRLVHEFERMDSGSLYLRAWLYMPAGSAVDDVHGIVLGDANVGDYGTKFLYSAGQLRVTTSAGDVDGTLDPPFDRWYCLRLELDIAATGSVRAYLDDELFADQTADTLPATGVHNVSAGIDFAGQAEPAELFVDEVLLDTAPITCFE